MKKITLNKYLAGLAAVTMFALMVIGLPVPALGAGNPSGTGQPSQTCLSSTAANEPGHAATALGSAFNEVSGIAGTVYAGNGISAIKANSPHAVSQYDVACYQVTVNH